MEAELDMLGEELELEDQEKLDDQLLNIGPAVGLPDVPTAVPTKPQPARARKEDKCTVYNHWIFECDYLERVSELFQQLALDYLTLNILL